MSMIYGWLAALYGALLSIMNIFNAQLSTTYGNWGATVMIHTVGLIVLAPLAFTWGKRKEKSPWYLHAGGVIGVLTVVFVNIGVSGIGVTANLVLMLLGQVTCSALMDHFGWMGVPVHRMNRDKTLALAVMSAGCAAMMLLSHDENAGTSVIAAVVSFLSGYTMVAARMANAELANRSGVGYSTVMNYITGLTTSFIVFAALGFKLDTSFPAPAHFSVYLGGALGAAGIFLCNVVTPKLPILQMSVIVFVGQLFSGMALDALLGRFSVGTLIGGALVAVGLLLNTRADSKEAARGNAVQSEKP